MACDRFNRWRKDGTWTRILDALLLRLDNAGRIDHDLWCVDGTVDQHDQGFFAVGKPPADHEPEGIRPDLRQPYLDRHRHAARRPASRSWADLLGDQSIH